MRNVMSEIDFCVFDLETTGFDPSGGDRPIEVAGVRLVDGEIQDTFQSLVNPDRAIPEEVQSLTGIQDEHVEDAPTPEAVLGEFLEFAGDAVLVAHNVEFDKKFLEAYTTCSVSRDYVDTLRMARKLLPETSHSLDYLVKQYNLNRNEGHRALEDARATADLFDILTEKVATFDDYRRCGIPERILKEDLEIMLSLCETSSQVKQKFRDDFSSTSQLLESSPEELPVETGPAKRVTDELEDLYAQDQLDRIPPPTLLTAFKIRYWTPVNLILNLIGVALILSSLFTVRADVFNLLFLCSIPFFLLSPVISYFRFSERPYLFQSAGVLSLLGGWIVLVELLGYREVILEALFYL